MNHVIYFESIKKLNELLEQGLVAYALAYHGKGHAFNGWFRVKQVYELVFGNKRHLYAFGVYETGHFVGQPTSAFVVKLYSQVKNVALVYQAKLSVA